MNDLIVDLALVNLNLNNKIRLSIKDDFATIRRTNTPYGELGELIYHMFEAINVWLDRITKNVISLSDYSKDLNDDSFFNEWIKVDKRFLDYANNLSNKVNFEDLIFFRNRSGESFQIPLQDILMHISHHSFYHRGQIATLIRINNFNPLPDLDWSKD